MRIPTNLRPAVAAALLVLAPVQSSAETNTSEGDCICREGVIMDQFCIQRERLLENSSLRTLESPDQHTMHCLLDVSWCVDSGFTVLADPEQPGGMYSVAAKFDDNGTDLVYKFAVDRGTKEGCDVCTERLGGVTKGFRAAVVGIVDQVGDAASSDPLARAPYINVTNVISIEDGGCSSFSCTAEPDSLALVDQSTVNSTTLPALPQPSSQPSGNPTNQPTVSSAPSVQVTGAPSMVPTPISQDMVDLNAAKMKWGQPESYEYAFQKSCFCAPLYIQPMYVIVKDGIKTNVTFIEDTLGFLSVEQDVADSVLTIEDQFRLLEQALTGDLKADYVLVQYDEDRGYPLVIWIDYKTEIADEEFQIFNTVQL